jgi:hypothetical protein
MRTEAGIVAVVRCHECAACGQLSRRRARDYRDRPWLCEDCRRPAVELTDEERGVLEAWWLERFSAEQLRRLAGAAFG